MKKLIITLLICFAILTWLSFRIYAAVGAHSVSLTWSDSDGTVVSYNIYRGNQTGVCLGTPTPYANSATKSYTDTAVVSGTTYVYAVSALNGTGGESACSSEAQ